MDASPLQYRFERVAESMAHSISVPSVVLTGHGRLQRIKVMDTPLTSIISDHHVEVQVYYCGLNFTDNYLRLGIIRSESFPIFMGSECCGIVRRVGAAVHDLEVGQRVLCLRMQGGLFRHVVHVPRSNCFVLPSCISLTAAAALALDFLVAYVCLFELGQLRNAGVVFMQSLAGGVGTVLAQLSRALPLVTVLGTASEQKHDRLWRLGVNRVYRHQEDFAERVLALYPEGADVVIVRGGGADTDKCLRLLKPCGRLIAIGSDNTAIYPRTITMALQRPTWDTRYISSAELINKNAIVAGLNIADLIENHPRAIQVIMDEMFNMHFQEKIIPQIHSIVPFEKMTDGLEILCRRENFGKVLLKVQDEADLRVRPSPQRPLASAVPRDEQVEEAERRVVCRRRVKLWVRRVAEATNQLEEVALGRGIGGLDDSMYTEVEAGAVQADSQAEPEGDETASS